jgi:hypothetical protein
MSKQSRRTESVAYATPPRRWTSVFGNVGRSKRRNTDFGAPDSPHPLIHPSLRASPRLAALLRPRSLLALCLLAGTAYLVSHSR